MSSPKPPADGPSGPFVPTEELEHMLRKCSPDTVAAAIEFRSTRNPELLEPILRGVLKRFVDPPADAQLEGDFREIQVVHHLGIDSLLLIEITLFLEDIVEKTLPHFDFGENATLQDIRDHISQAC